MLADEPEVEDSDRIDSRILAEPQTCGWRLPVLRQHVEQPDVAYTPIPGADRTEAEPCNSHHPRLVCQHQNCKEDTLHNCGNEKVLLTATPVGVDR